MTLRQQGILAVQLLPEEKLPMLIEFARFLNRDGEAAESSSDSAARRSALAGILKGQIRMAEDFNETPDVFKEYL